MLQHACLATTHICMYCFLTGELWAHPFSKFRQCKDRLQRLVRHVGRGTCRQNARESEFKERMAKIRAGGEPSFGGL